MEHRKNMDWLLDGSDWMAGYFLGEKEYDRWRLRSRNLHNQLLDSARSAGITAPDGARGDLMPATVPGCDRSVLLENGIIADPYFGRNLEMSSWSEKHSWGFRKCFNVPEQLRSARQLRLRFNGIDYRAMFFLNDVYLGTHTGMFMPVEFDVTALISREHANCLAVVFETAPAGLPDHRDEEPADFAAFHRVQCGFGWDWARAVVPTGIWDSVMLSGSNMVRIRDFHWQTKHEKVCLAVETEAIEKWSGCLRVRLTPENFDGEAFELTEPLSLTHGSNRNVLEFEFKGAKKWFPSGYGEPSLYKLTLAIDGRSETTLVGFRELEMRRNPDSPEDAYNLTFTVNGVDIFVRGANWVPVDLIPSRATPDDYARLVELAANARFNMLRVWGGGLVEKNAFYECCDRHGILVWQEFPHACSNYRKDAEYLAVKAREAAAILRKLRNHPSTALFCGGNEVQYYGDISDSPLYRMYRELTAISAPGIAFHTSSPDASRPGERPHGPWNYQEHAVYNRHFRQFASEIGCNAIPEAESLARFIPAGEEIPNGQSWRYHFLNLHGAHDVRIPLREFELSGVEEWSQASMFAQADAAGYIFEHYRRQAPQASGCLFWQFNEPWPTCSWSLVDYFKIPKIALYRLRRANAPRIFSLEDQSWCLRDGIFEATLWYCGDQEEFNGKATFELWDMDGHRLLVEDMALNIPKGVHRIKELRCECHHEASGIVLAIIRASDEKGCFRSDRLYGAPDFKSAFRCPAAQIERLLRQNGRNIELTLINRGKAPAFSVCAKSSRELIWRENYCSLAPGETLVYHAESEDLPVSYDDITIKGWNL